MVLAILLVSGLVLFGGGRWYSRRVSDWIGLSDGRPTPALRLSDGRDFVPTPTPVVFAHHFASIAGAGPIVGPVIALAFGWLPALLWVVLGGLLIGGVHDFLATFMATREGGQSIATVARRMLGRGVFIALALFLVLMLGLVCATFLNLSAAALTGTVDLARLDLDAGQQMFRTTADGKMAIIGGIASTSVILITAVAPLIGWMYVCKKTPVWICSALAMVVCGISIYAGLHFPVSPPETWTVPALGWTLTGTDIWKLLLAVYVLVAAGAPVWIFLQSRDFINVHILYVGMALLALTLVVAGVSGAGSAEPIPALSIPGGSQALGGLWPALFITIACGAVSGFHSLCAGGTTCKQLTREDATRTVGYFGMIAESFLAVCVIGVLLVGVKFPNYMQDVHLGAKPNPILGFAMGVGNAVHGALGLPKAAGAIGAMVLLEGFLVTTLDTAVRLTRYLIEEVWKALLGIRAEAGQGERKPWIVRQYWVNSGLAVAMMLMLALGGGASKLWGIFATSNQLLAAFGLLLGALWLLRQGRKVWFALLPALAMLATTGASMLGLLQTYLRDRDKYMTLLVADVVMMALTAYLLVAGTIKAVGLMRAGSQPPEPQAALEPVGDDAGEKGCG